jgi:hypothetical protein
MHPINFEQMKIINLLRYIKKAIQLYGSGGLCAVTSGLLRFIRFRHLWHVFNLPHKIIFEWKNGSGIAVMQEDWDNLIILDACRYDIFENYSNFDGSKLKKVISKGSWSLEFIKQNFWDGEFHDTVYVTANGFCERIPDQKFFKIVKLYSQRHGTEPGIVTKAAIETAERYPNKRIIIHYMQPHAPHLGEIGRSVDGRIFNAARSNLISDDRLIDSYIENFLIVQDHVKKLSELLDGKTVISSDHGENLGEYGYSSIWKYSKFGPQRKKLYSHGHQTPECRFIPWCELTHKSRKQIKESAPMHNSLVNSSLMTENLENLGYL